MIGDVLFGWLLGLGFLFWGGVGGECCFAASFVFAHLIPLPKFNFLLHLTLLVVLFP